MLDTMKHLVILGAGTAGTIVANASRHRLPSDWQVVVVDPSARHTYQPGLLFVPFGGPTDLERPRVDTFAHGVDWVRLGVSEVDALGRRVTLSNNEVLPYDLLVVATGCRARPDLVEGLTGEGWGTRQHEFYTLDGARRLASALDGFRGGRLVVNVVDTPITHPMAPLEFAFLAEAFLTARGLRAQSEIVYVTPDDTLFARPLAAKRLGDLFAYKNLKVVTEFSTRAVDGATRTLRSFDGREEAYDLLVSIAPHVGAHWVEAGAWGDARGFVRTDPKTLRARAMDHVFAIGDATDLPCAKAGSVAHYQANVLVDDLARIAAGEDPVGGFDGHASFLVETGHGRAMLVDYSNDVEPQGGTFPLPGIGPFTRLEETRANHWGRTAFQWMYWNGLLPARPMPVPTHMGLVGRELPPSLHRPY